MNTEPESADDSLDSRTDDFKQSDTKADALDSSDASDSSVLRETVSRSSSAEESDSSLEEEPGSSLVEESAPSLVTHAENSLGSTDSSGFVLDPDADLLPEKIGRYRILSQLGRGGFGFVYKAFDPYLECEVAIKVPRWDRLLYEGEAERFLREAQTLAKMRNNAAIVTVYDVAKTSGNIPFAVMEFVEGKSLSDFLAVNEVTLDDGLEILLKIAEALKDAHQASVVHRDLKPSNIIMDSSHNITLVDFGLALHGDLSMEELGTAIEGTPLYMAPEQIRGENHRIDGQTDVWAFGVVMYRMLTGSYPFKAKDNKELARAIRYKDAKPLRQLNPEIPKSVERICLKCLSKMMSDRYQSMTDLIDDLQVAIERLGEPETDSLGNSSFQAQGDSSHKNTAHSHQQSDTDFASGRSGQSANSRASGFGASSGVGMSSVTYKGLRPFESNDHDFFLRLLPGPRTRDGIPESVQFWNDRISGNELEPLNVGLIYGPSGCGKSSFIRAGLLPTLPGRVNPVYLESTPKNTEARLVRQIAHRINTVDESKTLTEVLRQFRRGEHLADGDSLLIVLDQFEQWLYGNQNHEQQELTNALRQCDGKNINCILLIRDDFWMSTSQFMKCLEIPVREGLNSLVLPMFDRRHARKVLVAFGRSFDRLPVGADDQGDRLASTQRKFIRDAVDSLAVDSKVNCVHLSVFAKIAQDREWTASELQRLGGLKGAGVRYLDDVLGGVRNNETQDRMVRSILQQLLPASDMNIKGTSHTSDQLRSSISGDFSEPVFRQSLERLEKDLGLISVVESAEEEFENEQPDEYNYRLTHDFLVAPIREWLDRRQQETRSGRSQQRLVSLGDAWNSTQDICYLPGAVEYLGFKRHASRHLKTNYRSFLKQSRNKFLRTLAVVGLVSMLFASLAWYSWNDRQNQIAARHVENYLSSSHANKLVYREQLETWTSRATPFFESELESESAVRRLRASDFLIKESGSTNPGELVSKALLDAVKQCSLTEYRESAASLMQIDSSYLDSLEQWTRELQDEGKQVDYSMLLLECDRPELARIILDRKNSSARSRFIQDAHEFGIDVANAMKHAAKISETDFTTGLVLALSRYWEGASDGPSPTAKAKENFVRQVSELYQSAASTGSVRSTAEYALRVCGQDPERTVGSNECPDGWANVKLPGDITITFVGVSGCEFDPADGLTDGIIKSYALKPFFMLEGKATVEDFYVASDLINADLYRHYIDQLDADDPARHWLEGKSKTANDSDKRKYRYPAVEMRFNEAVEYCNWLNKQIGCPAYYEKREVVGDEEANEQQATQSAVYKWKVIDPMGPGFRLPTVFEWWRAYKADTKTLTPFSDSTELPYLSMYSWFEQRTPEDTDFAPLGLKMPNQFGLFDMIGNQNQLCYEENPIEVKNGYDTQCGGHVRSIPKFIIAGSNNLVRDGLIANYGSFRLAMNPNTLEWIKKASQE